jgi:hypothetical protein
MKFIVLFFLLPLSGAAQNPARPSEIVDPPTRFDEWTTIPFSDEKARLDNLAIHWRQSPRMVIYIVIYAGKKACVGEAEARWTRVRDWLVRKRGVPAEKLSWVDGGYREQSTLTCWLWPPELGKPPEPYRTLKRNEVKVIKGCRIFVQRAR